MMGEFAGPLILRVGSQVAPGLAPWLGERVLAPSHFFRSMLHKSLRQRLKVASHNDWFLASFQRAYRSLESMEPITRCVLAPPINFKVPGAPTTGD
jgi:hypothetical protein